MTGHSIIHSEWVNNYPPFILAELLPHRPILSLLPCQVSGTPNAATVLHSALCPFPHPARDFPPFSLFFPFHTAAAPKGGYFPVALFPSTMCVWNLDTKSTGGPYL